MASRASLNKVILIGNLTRDPELRYTPQGNAVCTFGVATNRTWTSSAGGERKEDTEFHRIVSWNKLAELCSQLLTKGRKVFVEGRLQTRSWQTPDGQQRQITEIVISDMRILDSRRPSEEMEDLADLDKEILSEGVPITGAEPKPDEAPAETGVSDQVVESKKDTGKTEEKPAAESKTSKAKTKKEEPASSSESTDDDDILKDLPF